MALELSAAQGKALSALQQHHYVEQVARDIVGAYPDTARPSLEDELRAAHQYAQALGFRDGAAITTFLWTSALAPGFYREPMIDDWLRRPGMPVEQRFNDLRAVALNELTRQQAAQADGPAIASGVNT